MDDKIISFVKKSWQIRSKIYNSHVINVSASVKPYARISEEAGGSQSKYAFSMRRFYSVRNPPLNIWQDLNFMF